MNFHDTPSVSSERFIGEYDWRKIKANLPVIDRALGFLGGYRLKPHALAMKRDKSSSHNIVQYGAGICFNPVEKDPHCIAKAIADAIEAINTVKKIKGDESSAISLCLPETHDDMRSYAILNGCEGHIQFSHEKGFPSAFAGGTEKGDNEREGNQDGMLVNPQFRMIAVADGMGGHAGGETASTVALNKLYELRKKGAHLDSLARPICRYLQYIFFEYLEKYQPKIFNRLRSDRRMGSLPGTTLSFLEVFDDSRIEGFLIGDSPIYIIDLLMGRIVCKPELQHNPYMKNVLTNCIRPLRSGEQLEKQPEYVNVTVPKGGKYLVLICSDGVTGVINEDEIVAIAQKHGEDTWRELLELARKRKSTDNCTACQMIVNG